MKKPCHTENCPMRTDEDYDGASTVDSNGVDHYCASCNAIQRYFDSGEEEDDDE